MDLLRGIRERKRSSTGLCEVIERDQVSFWSVEQDSLNAGGRRRVIVQSIRDPVCRPLVEKCLSAGLEIFIWHATINIDIPVFTCTIIDRRNATPFPQQASGYGCHPIATIALARAITEAAQSRVTHISGLREDLTWSRYREEFPSETPRESRGTGENGRPACNGRLWRAMRGIRGACRWTCSRCCRKSCNDWARQTCGTQSWWIWPRTKYFQSCSCVSRTWSTKRPRRARCTGLAGECVNF